MRNDIDTRLLDYWLHKLELEADDSFLTLLDVCFCYGRPITPEEEERLWKKLEEVSNAIREVSKKR